jgi:hypothetical protein
MKNCYNCKFYNSYSGICVNNPNLDIFDEDEIGRNCYEFIKGIYKPSGYEDEDIIFDEEYDELEEMEE